LGLNKTFNLLSFPSFNPVYKGAYTGPSNPYPPSPLLSPTSVRRGVRRGVRRWAVPPSPSPYSVRRGVREGEEEIG